MPCHNIEKDAVQYLFDFINKSGPFDGLFGFS
jgi:hypothetical protein